MLNKYVNMTRRSYNQGKAVFSPMDLQNMNIEASRNGFYTVTFENTSCLSEKEVRNELSSVGEVCSVVFKKNRVFIRYKYKEEAQRALMKYGKILKLRMAFNNKRSRKPQLFLEEEEDDDDEEEEDLKDLKDHKQKTLPSPKPKFFESNIDSKNNDLNDEEKNFCLVLSNLPKKYLFKDVRALIEETKPLWVELDETKVFNIKFAYVILDSLQKVSYLIEKLNGFVICGEKLIAMEANRLLKWRCDGEKVTT